MNSTAAQIFAGDCVKTFRFDIFRMSVPGSLDHEVVLLTAKTDKGITWARGFSKALGVELARDLTAAQAKLGHAIDLVTFAQDPANALGPDMTLQTLKDFVQSGPPDLMPGGLADVRTDYIKVMHVQAWPSHYTFDATTVDDSTFRFSLESALIFMFTEQLKECLISIK